MLQKGRVLQGVPSKVAAPSSIRRASCCWLFHYCRVFLPAPSCLHPEVPTLFLRDPHLGHVQKASLRDGYENKGLNVDVGAPLLIVQRCPLRCHVQILTPGQLGRGPYVEIGPLQMQLSKLKMQS